jgi:FAD synthase
MDEFSLKLTRDECQQLLRHVFIANWVLTATNDVPEKKSDDFNQTILKFLKTNEIETRIDKDKKMNMYFVDETLERKFHEEIEAYNEDIFIEELIDQLTKKEIAKNYGEAELARMNEVKFNKVFDGIQEKYISEIETNGIRNIEVVKPSQSGH